jgi:hypothetical protein
MDEVEPELKLSFKLGKAEKLMAIASEPLLANSSNRKILPPHISTLFALAKPIGRSPTAPGHVS